MREYIHNILQDIISEHRVYDTPYQYADIELEKLKDRDDIYIQFTDTDKFGIYPMTHTLYNTPAGVYTYPLKEIWDEKHKHQGPKVSFGKSRKYINVIQVDKDMTIDVKQYTTNMLHEDINYLLEYTRKKYGLTYSDEKASNIFNQAIIARYNDKRSIMFDLFMFCIQLINTIKFDLQNQTMSQAWMWNGMLRYLGYTAITDKHGTGTIHLNEPIQAVILDLRFVKLVMRLNNISYRAKGQSINDMSPEEQLKMIQKYGWDIIGKISNPSFEFEKMLIDSIPYSVRFLKNGMSKKAKEYFINRNPDIADFIDDINTRD